MSKPLVSIITVTFNSEATVADTLRSVASQDYDNVEHLIVDGASTDATLQIVEQWRPEYGSVKVLRVSSSPDKGIYDAMNKGLKMAKGEIVGILNSDDYFSTETSLSTLIDAFDDDTDAVYADLHYIMDERPDLVVRYYSSRVFSRRKMLMGFQPAHPTFYCRKQCYDRFGHFDIDFKVAADFEQLLRMIYKGRIRTRYVPFDCVTMRMGGSSTSGMKSHRQIMRDHIKAYRKNRVPANRFTDALRYFWKLGEMAGARINWHHEIIDDSPSS